MLLAVLLLVVSESVSGSTDLALLEETNEVFLKQAMMQQLETEERLRSAFSSGLTSVPQTTGGTEPFHTETNQYLLPMRNYANTKRQVGLGQFSALLNGVSFQTATNGGFRLSMPHRTSKALHAMEDIPFPAVPKAVTSKRTVAEQVAEMKQWFKAWATQDENLRPYKPHFKAVLCILEGAWMRLPNNEYGDDLSAQNQQSLFNAYAGHVDGEENVSFIPTTILEIGNDSVPVMAKWDHRIVCHPLKNDLPLDKFHPIDNFVARVDNKWSMEKLKGSRAARFILNPSLKNKAFKDSHFNYAFRDVLMGEIPGKDNYGVELEDTTFNYRSNHIITGKPINAGLYHSWYKVNKVGAMGLQTRHRGWSDQHVYMAKTTQKDVGPLKARHECDARTKKCKYYAKSSWTWAFPTEVMYLTSLPNWNPYGIKVSENTDQFYLTPAEFFSGPEVDPDHADTVREYIEVKNSKGQKVKVRASGIRPILPEIEGVGTIRQRYSICPLDVEGSAEWKELTALKDVTLDYRRHKMRMGLKEDVLLGKFQNDKAADETTLHFQLQEVAADINKQIISHNHELMIDYSVVRDLKNGKLKSYDCDSEQASGHTHQVTVVYKKGVFQYTQCDGLPPPKLCHDGHAHRLIQVSYPDES